MVKARPRSIPVSRTPAARLVRDAHLALLNALLVVLIVPGGEAYAQRLRVGYEAPRGLGGPSVGKIANTAVSRSFNTGNPGASAFSRPRGTFPTATPVILNPYAGVGRGRPGKLDLVDRPPAQARAQTLPNRWRRDLSLSGAARYFAIPPQYGQYRAGVPTGGARVVEQLFDAEKLARSTAFTTPVRYSRAAVGGARDPLSHATNSLGSELARLDSAEVEPLDSPNRRAQSEVMNDRLVAMRTRAMAEAWSRFRKGDYQRARSSFESAEMLDRDDPEPRSGIFFCYVAEGSYLQALQAMNRVVTWDVRRGVFDLDLRLEERFQSDAIEDPVERRQAAERRLSAAMEGFKAFFDKYRTQGPVQVAASYALWHTGNRQEALLLADIIRKNDPNGPYGNFANRMLEADNGAEIARGG